MAGVPCPPPPSPSAPPSLGGGGSFRSTGRELPEPLKASFPALDPGSSPGWLTPCDATARLSGLTLHPKAGIRRGRPPNTALEPHGS